LNKIRFIFYGGKKGEIPRIVKRRIVDLTVGIGCQVRRNRSFQNPLLLFSLGMRKNSEN